MSATRPQAPGAPRQPVSHRINAERLVVLGWPRAILLQLAHPLVAAGVNAHSTFRTTPIAAVHRLHQTVQAMLALTFGGPEGYARAVADIRRIHDRVHGVLKEDVGIWRAGTPYSAHDPALLLWVHATVLESNVMAFEALVAPLTPADRDAYCREAIDAAVEIGVSAEAVPRGWQALTDYIGSVQASDTLCVGGDARTVAAAVLDGPSPLLARLSAQLTRPLTAAWLPDALRTAYALAWTPTAQRRALARQHFLRRLRRVTPNRLACWPVART